MQALDGFYGNNPGQKQQQHAIGVSSQDFQALITKGALFIRLAAAVARGHPFGAAGAVLVARLFTRMARTKGEGPKLGVATLGVRGGMGLAAAFEAV